MSADSPSKGAAPLADVKELQQWLSKLEIGGSMYGSYLVFIIYEDS